MRRAAIPCIVLMSGCLPVAHVAGPVLELAFREAGVSLEEREERQAEADAYQAAESKRLRENEQVRLTTARLQREREITMAIESRRAHPADGSIPVPQGVAARLDAAMIRDAVARVKANVMACRGERSVTGNVLVSMKVAPDGHVVDAAIVTTPDPELAICVASAVGTASFAQTETGGSFRYPFVF